LKSFSTERVSLTTPHDVKRIAQARHHARREAATNSRAKLDATRSGFISHQTQ